MVDEMAVESERRLSLMDATKSPPTPRADSPGAENAGGGKPEGSSVTEGSAGKGPAKPGSPAPASDAPPPLDLSFIDEKHRPSFAGITKEAAEYLKDKLGDEAGLRWSDYSQKTMAISAKESALAEREASLKQRQGDLEWVDSLDKDPEALALLRDLAERRRSGGAAKSGKPFDWANASPEEVAAHEAELRKQAADEAVARIRGEDESRTKAQQAIDSLDAEVSKSLIGSGDYTIEQVGPVFVKLGRFDGMRALAKASGEEFTSDYVVRTLRGILPPPSTKAAAAPKDSPGGTGAARNGAGGASSLGRGTGSAPPINAPAFVREKRDPKNLSERMQESLWLTNQKRAARGLPPLDD